MLKKILLKSPLRKLIYLLYADNRIKYNYKKKYFALIRWHVLIEFIKENGYTKIAEIGIDRGQNTQKILESCNIEKYILVEPIVYEPFRKWCRKYKSVDYMEMRSNIAVNFIEDESLDLVFIDGDHSYEEVKKDIQMWLPKVRKGGMLTGHDYNATSGVKKAVEETLGKVDYISIEAEYNKGKFEYNNIFYLKK